MAHSLSPSSLLPSPPGYSAARNPDLVTMPDIVARNPGRIVVLFAESTTTNGRGILPLSPSLASTPPDVPIFPTSLRYNPADVTTPVPGWRATWRFIWTLCSAPTHTIRVRIAEPLQNTPADGDAVKATGAQPNSYATNFFDQFQREGKTAAKEVAAGREVMNGGAQGEGDKARLTAEERRVLDRVGEALARLGRVKRVALNVKDKGDFVRLWRKRGRA